MIIEIENDIIKLKGNINKNLWPATLAAAEMIIGAGYKNIIVDCSKITQITDHGLETFSNAFSYLSRRNLNLFFVSVNDDVLYMAKKLPGIRSSMPIGDTVEEIRASIEMNKNKDKIYSKKSLLFPVIGNPSHAIVFADLLEDKNVEIDCVYPMIVPLKYNLYQPIKFLENKANADLVRLEGFCIFNDRKSTHNVIRVRSYKEFYEKITKQYINSSVFLSFTNCQLDRNHNQEKLNNFITCQNLKGLMVCEPKRDDLFVEKIKSKNILIYVNDNEIYNKKCKSIIKKITNKDTIIEYVKLNKINFNEAPKQTLDYIENFNTDDTKYKCKTVDVRDRSRYLTEYVKQYNINFLIVPVLNNDINFITNLCKDPACTTLFVK